MRDKSHLSTESGVPASHKAKKAEALQRVAHKHCIASWARMAWQKESVKLYCFVLYRTVLCNAHLRDSGKLQSAWFYV